MNILTVDIGGNNVKLLATGESERRKFSSGPKLTPSRMVTRIKQITKDWRYDVISIGYPGRVAGDRAVTDPRNLGPGWVGFDFSAALERPVKLINDAEMQALGSYDGGTMLFLGLGTGLGSALIVNGHIVSMELGALSYRKGTIEDYVGQRGLDRVGPKKWRKMVARMTERFTSALLLDDCVIGGGNAKVLKKAPPGCRLGANTDAFVGGFRLWEPVKHRHPHAREQSSDRKTAAKTDDRIEAFTQAHRN